MGSGGLVSEVDGMFFKVCTWIDLLEIMDCTDLMRAFYFDKGCVYSA